MAMNALLNAALGYAAKGWPVFPLHWVDGNKKCSCGKPDCKHQGKHPFKKLTSNGFKNATVDEATIKKWWGEYPQANIGIATGKVSGIFVLDLDSETAKREAEKRGLPRTFTVRTPRPEGGYHFYFKHPGGSVKIKSKSGWLAHLDTKGDGGYVVAPPSSHVNGFYEVLVSCEEAGEADGPQWLFELMEGEQKGRKKAERVGTEIPAGTRHSVLVSLAGTMVRRGMSLDAVVKALDIENKLKCKPPLGHKEVYGIARSVSEYGPGDRLAPEKAKKEKPARKPTRKCSLEECIATFRRWLLLPDDTPIRFVLATVVANRFPGDPVWSFLIASSGGCKTELIVALSGVKGVHPLSSLTARTLISGQRRTEKMPCPSLIERLGPEAILTLKDFTTVLELRPDEQKEILSQLRELYDGRYRKDFGTGDFVDWKGQLGFIAGVTQIIDNRRNVYSLLGERFLQLRLSPGDRYKVTDKALKQSGEEDEMRKELREVVTAFLNSIPQGPQPAWPADLRKTLIHVADFCARSRSGVIRDRFTKEIVLLPEPETPTRLAKQFYLLGQALALMRGASKVEKCDLNVIQRVGVDSIPVVRWQVLSLLFNYGEFVKTSLVAEYLALPPSTTRRHLYDLQGLNLVREREGTSQRGSGYWVITKVAADLMQASGVTSQISKKGGKEENNKEGMES